MGQIVEGQLSTHLVADVLHHDIVFIVSLDLLETTQELLLGVIDRAIRVIARGIDTTRLDSMREVTVVLSRLIGIEANILYDILLVKAAISVLS